MSVLQVSTSLDYSLGGPVAVVTEIQRYLVKEYGAKLVVFGLNNSDAKARRIPTLFNNRYGIPKRILAKGLVQDLRKADFIMVHGYYLFSTLLIITFAKKSRFAIMPHGSLEEYQQVTSRYRKWFFDILVKSVMGKRKLNFFVASDSEAIHVARRFPRAGIKVVGLGIPLEKYEISPRRELHSPITLLSLSRIAKKKRIDLTIRAVKMLRDKGLNVRLEIYGKGEKSILLELQSVVSELGIADFVIFRGHVEPSNFKQVFENADIFVLPSENENFAVAVAEALAHEIPTIVSEFVAMHEFVIRNRTGVVIQTLIPDELVKSVITVIDNYEDYVRNAKVSKAQLGWNYVFPKWASGIEEIMGAPNGY